MARTVSYHCGLPLFPCPCFFRTLLRTPRKVLKDKRKSRVPTLKFRNPRWVRARYCTEHPLLGPKSGLTRKAHAYSNRANQIRREPNGWRQRAKPHPPTTPLSSFHVPSSYFVSRIPLTKKHAVIFFCREPRTLWHPLHLARVAYTRSPDWPLPRQCPKFWASNFVLTLTFSTANTLFPLISDFSCLYAFSGNTCASVLSYDLNSEFPAVLLYLEVDLPLTPARCIGAWRPNSSLLQWSKWSTPAFLNITKKREGLLLNPAFRSLDLIRRFLTQKTSGFLEFRRGTNQY